MADLKRPKWDGGVTVSKGKQTLSLFDTYQSELSLRIAADEISQFRANIPALEKKLSGKDKELSEQKSSTSVQVKTVKTLNDRIVSFRKVVRSSNPGDDIKDAFGLGTKIVLTVMGVAGPADTIVEAYNHNKAWSNGVGILEKDIAEITALTNSLFSADDVQQQSIFARKAATMNVNTLQRQVEDIVTRISMLGVHEFEIINPAVAGLFAGLIPVSPKSKKTKPV